VAETSGLVGWILSFGSQVGVIRPDSLRNKVTDEAKQILTCEEQGLEWR
jgi:predicted DNA-binding transcriptional regulator YafY